MKTGKLFREMDLIAKRRGLFKVSIERVADWEHLFGAGDAIEAVVVAVYF
jgi:hypothetical protein